MTAINALAGMGILTDDDSLIDAALSELKSLPLDLRHRRDPRRDYSYILKQHHLGQVSHHPSRPAPAPSYSPQPQPCLSHFSSWNDDIAPHRRESLQPR